MATASLSYKVFEKAVKSALQKVNIGNISSLTQPQTRSLFTFLCGNDTFVSLPTGHGKSLIYQICPLVAKELSDLEEQFPAEPMLFVVSPLNSLIADQINSCERMGIKACKVDIESTISLQKRCDYQLLYASPEVFDNKDVRKLLKQYCDRIIGIVIDESHCVVQWGTADQKGEKPFRESYGRVGHLRGFTRAPFLCMTATASSQIRQKIIKLLNMKNTKLIRQSPDKKNIYYSAEKASDMEETFQWILKRPISEISKTIIYCRSLKDCGEIYSLFDSPQVSMYHSKTPEKIKEKVLQSFMEKDGKCSIIIATSALGMGVNIQDVRQIIHYGVPSDLETYVQEVGRGGRDGKPCKATLYYRPFHLAHCNEQMRTFVKNTEKKCRREVLMNYFKEKPNKPDLPHDCCDACLETCKCGTCVSSLQQLPARCYNESEENSENVLSSSRNVDEEDRKFLGEMLKEIRSKTRPASSVFGSFDLATELNQEIIEAITSKCQYIFSIDYIMENFPVFNKQVALEILTIINEIFDDIEEWEFFNTMVDASCLLDDKLFLDVVEQVSGSDTETELDNDDYL